MNHDVIIVGGGIVGLTFACLLAQETSLSIAVLEAQSESSSWSPSSYYHRVSALSITSQRILNSLNIWNKLAEKRVSPFIKIQVWDGSRQGKIQFDSQEIAETVLGYIVENNLLHTVLREKSKEYLQIEVFSSIKLKQFNSTAQGVEFITDDKKKFSARMAIAADGVKSWLRTKANIDCDVFDYKQEAIVATVKTVLPHQQIARQVFLETGPLAFLPLSDANTSSIVWSLPTQEARRLLDINVDKFKFELAQAFSSTLGAIELVDTRHSFPLHKQHAKNYVRQNVVLVGDAAHTLHPLAGQGLNLGLLDAICLAQIIKNEIKRGRDFANDVNLRRYERKRKAENLTMLGSVHLLEKLFSSEIKILQNLRSFGLSIVDQTKWLKKIFINYAVGEKNTSI